jgi:dihydroorotate dehydrogenase (NAD+) catalytic subunit
VKPDLSVSIGGKKLQNPVGVASGTFGYGSEYEKLIDLDSLGALYTKAVTLEARPGNAVPRIVETAAGMLNSIGLANPGLEVFVAEKLPALKRHACAVIVNVAGSNEDDYVRVVERLETENDIWGYEINISCPNVKCGGMALGTDTLLVERLTRRLREATKRPLIVKLSPNVTDITSIANAAESGGADALSCINTLVGMVINVKKRVPALAAGTGGLSGPAILPVGVACTYRVAKAVKIPVIGCGGISNTDDALQYFLAGARAIQVGTVTFVEPEASINILRGLETWMENEGVARISDIPRLFHP